MMFSSRPTRRQSSRTSAVAAGILQTEICEQRLVLTPSVITPTGNFQTLTDTAGQNFTPEIQWTAEPAAVSYDLWVSSLESYDTVFVQRGMTDTFYPTDGLPLGKLRIWVRANFADSTSTPWSVSAQPINVTPPNDVAVDGATGTRHIVNDNTPTVTWNSPDLAHRFQIWLTDLSHNVSPRLYLVDNLTPTLDADGNEVLDADGNTIPQEIRSFEIPDQLEIGRYRIWVRAFDQSARNTAWSSSYTFDVGPAPTNLTPAAPTFQDSPVLGWDSVAGATHYEVYLSDAGSTTAYFRRTVAADTTAARQSAQIIRSVAGTPIVENGNDTVENTERPRLDSSGNEVPFYLPDGSYDFWVRAIYRDTTSTSNPVIYGAWTAATRFSTLVAPTITGPVADNGVVTDPTPTVEWSAIDGAARYQIYVHRFNTRPPFLEAESSVNSYTFETSLPADTYYVWVRAIDTRGNFSPWSAPYQIVSTGGAPLILTPTANQQTNFPAYSWVAVPGAASYEIWVSHIGVDFTFLNVDGITATSYSSADPINAGDYRVWVRAIFADGTAGPWSAPVDFQGLAAIETSDGAEQPLLLAGLTSSEPDVSANAAQQTESADDSRDFVPADLPAQQAEQQMTQPATVSAGVSPLGDITAPNGDHIAALPAAELSAIAADCELRPWWESDTDTRAEAGPV